MSDISFLLDADESAALELKLGQYIKGDKGEQGKDGEQGPPGTLTPEDEALLAQAVSDAQGAANAAAGSASSAAQSATNAANSATAAKNDGQAAAQAAQASATAAKTSETNAYNYATTAMGAQGAAEAAQKAAEAAQGLAQTSATNAAQWEALAKDWATKTTGTVDGADYSAKYYALQTVSSAQAASNSAANAKTSETNAAASAAAAASSAASIDPASLVKKAGDTMTGSLALSQGSNLTLSGTTNAGQVMFNDSGGSSFLAHNPAGGIAGSGIGFGSNTLSAWNFQVTDTGNATLRGAFTINGAALNMQAQSGGYASFLDFHPNAGQTVRVGVQNDASTKELFITNASNSSRVMRVDDNGNVTTTGMVTPRGGLGLTAGATITYNSPSGNYTAYSRSDDAAYWGILNNALNNWNLQIFDNGDGRVRGKFMSGAMIEVQGNNSVYFKAVGGANLGRLGPWSNGLGIVNAAENTWTFQIDNSGNTNISGNFTSGGGLNSSSGESNMHNRLNLWNKNTGGSGELAVQNDGGGMFYYRGRGSGGGEWINGGYSASVVQIADDGVLYCKSLTQTSDYRLKENVETIDGADALARVQAMRPVSFDWIENGKPSRGFIAHELAQAEPVAVTGEKDATKPSPDGETQVIDPQTVDNTPIIADLVAALQAVTARLAALEGRAAG